MRGRALARIAAVLLIVAGFQAVPVAAGATATPIRHFVVLMQSNHSFDNYFGTYPGADGVPTGTCMRLSADNPSPDGCIKPYPLGSSSVDDLDHSPSTQRAQYDGGRMDGFVAAYRDKGLDGTGAMGYYDEADLPYYWNVADRYTLFDRFFSSAPTGTHQNRFYWVAGVPTPGASEQVPPGGYGDIPTIFDRLQAQGVSWKFYVENYDARVNLRTPGTGALAGQPTRVPPLNFARFVDDPALAGHIVDLSEYNRDLLDGTLPAVAYVASAGSSENPPSRVQAGQTLVQAMTSDLAKSRYWSSSAFLWTYDGWGGWYDHVQPPTVDGDRYGFRVPALLVSPYSPAGLVDHATLDYTAVLNFIERNWQLTPLSTRDARSPGLFSAFDFTAAPRPPELVTTGRAAAATTHPAAVVYLVYGAAALLAVACALGAAPFVRSVLRRRFPTTEEPS